MKENKAIGSVRKVRIKRKIVWVVLGSRLRKFVKRRENIEGSDPACRRLRVGKKSLNYVLVFCTCNPHWQFLEMPSFSLICILDYDFSG